MIFVDFEASGLGPFSFPIELGWAWCEADAIEARSLLIRPIDAWVADVSSGWDPMAESLHGLSLHRIQREGSPVESVVQMLNTAASAAEISFDTGYNGLDWQWLQKLYDAAHAALELNISREATGTTILKLADQASIGDVAWTALEQLAPKPLHQAAVDASRWAWWSLAISRVVDAGLAGVADLNRGIDLIRPVVEDIAIRGYQDDPDRIPRQQPYLRSSHRPYLPW